MPQPPNVAGCFKCRAPLLLHRQHLMMGRGGRMQQRRLRLFGGGRRGEPKQHWPSLEGHLTHHGVRDERFGLGQQVLHFEGRQLARLVASGAHRQLFLAQQCGGRCIQLGRVVNGLWGQVGGWVSVNVRVGRSTATGCCILPAPCHCQCRLATLQSFISANRKCHCCAWCATALTCLMAYSHTTPQRTNSFCGRVCKPVRSAAVI